MGRILHGGMAVLVVLGLGLGLSGLEAQADQLGLQEILDSGYLVGLKREKLTQIEFQLLSGSEGNYQVSVKYEAHPALSVSKAYPSQELDLNEAVRVSLADQSRDFLAFSGRLQNTQVELPPILIRRIAKFLRNEGVLAEAGRAGQDPQLRVIKLVSEVSPSEYEVQLDYQIHDSFYFGIVATREEAGRPAPRSHRGASVVEALAKAFGLDLVSMHNRIKQICSGQARRAALAWYLASQARLGDSKAFQSFFIDGFLTKRTVEERIGDCKNLLFAGQDGTEEVCDRLKRAKVDDDSEACVNENVGCLMQ